MPKPRLRRIYGGIQRDACGNFVSAPGRIASNLANSLVAQQLHANAEIGRLMQNVMEAELELAVATGRAEYIRDGREIDLFMQRINAKL